MKIRRELSTAASLATEVAAEANAAYWLEVYDSEGAEGRISQMHDDFKRLAYTLGYDFVRKSDEVAA